jgi:hypothetical protein
MTAPIAAIGVGIDGPIAAIHVDGELSFTCASYWTAVPPMLRPALTRPRRPLASWPTGS